MALKGLDIFKLSPKKNCKECGCPTCMAFSMKVASGAIELSKCPYFSADALASLSEATAPPMKTIKVGTGDAEQSLPRWLIQYPEALCFQFRALYCKYSFQNSRCTHSYRSSLPKFRPCLPSSMFLLLSVSLLRLHRLLSAVPHS